MIPNDLDTSCCINDISEVEFDPGLVVSFGLCLFVFP